MNVTLYIKFHVIINVIQKYLKIFDSKIYSKIFYPNFRPELNNV